MYLAPLNFDRFFKRVFSDLEVARVFLEDVLDTPIEEIEPFERATRLTDRAVGVEFDFRCKIRGQMVVIEMQQWYKTDVVKRFYLYHAAQTVLQLETLNEKAVPSPDEATRSKGRVTKDYAKLEPVVTMIWLVSEKLCIEESSMSFVMTPETVHDFLNSEIWIKADTKKLLEEREKLLAILKNNTKNMQFLAQNRLIFLFQSNVTKKLQSNKKFERWFRFAKLTLNKENKENDFAEFDSDPLFAKIMHILDKSALSPDDVKYIADEEGLLEKFELYEQGIRDEGKTEGKTEGRTEGKVTLLSKQFAKKFKTSPSVIEEIIASQDNQTLDNLGENVFPIESIEDLKGYIKQQ